MPKSNLLRSPRIFLKKQQAEFEARQREIEALNQQILNNFQPTKGNEAELAPVLENYVPQDNTTVTKPVLMSEDEALGILQNPNATEEDILKARKTLSPTFKEPVLTSLPPADMDFSAATSILENPNANPADLAEAQEFFSDREGLVGSGRGEYGMPTEPMPTEPMPTEARLDPYMEIPKSDAPAGYHRMDDGTLMSDSDMSTEAVLSDENAKVANNTPILMDDNTNQANSRSFSASSANARGSSMPYDKIGRNEMLMRAGGRIMANSDLGLNKALGAGMDEYGQIQDANRANEIAKFNQDETTRLAEARMAAAKAKADAKNNKPVSPESLRYGQAALASINSIQSSLDNDTSKNIFDSMNIFDNATGIFGNLLKSVPTTEAHSVMLNIETIEAAVAFDRLQAMRNASKTGGALGQVSNIELRLLSSSLGNLKQSNNKEEFQRNLDQVKKVYNEIVHGKDYQDPSDVINPTNNNDALYNEADAIIG